MLGRALVTGGSGFVGARLVRALAPSGRLLRAVYHRVPPPHVAYPPIEWQACDLVDGDVEGAVRDVATVFHIAGVAVMTSGRAETALMNRVNTEATLRLAAASKWAGVRQFIFVSSVDAGEEGATAELDERLGHPVRSYGESKRRAEDALLKMSTADFAVTILRPSVLFGPGHLGSVHELARSIVRGRFAFIGSGDNRMNFYFIDDFIAAMIAVEGNEAAFGEVFIAADQPQTLREFVTELVRLVNPSGRVRSVPLIVGSMAGVVCDALAPFVRRPLPLSRRRVRRMTRDVVYSNAKLKQRLGIQPLIGWKAGLRETTDWYRSNGLL